MLILHADRIEYHFSIRRHDIDNLIEFVDTSIDIISQEYYSKTYTRKIVIWLKRNSRLHRE